VLHFCRAPQLVLYACSFKSRGPVIVPPREGFLAARIYLSVGNPWGGSFLKISCQAPPFKECVCKRSAASVEQTEASIVLSFPPKGSRTELILRHNCPLSRGDFLSPPKANFRVRDFSPPNGLYLKTLS